MNWMAISGRRLEAMYSCYDMMDALMNAGKSYDEAREEASKVFSTEILDLTLSVYFE